MYCSSRPDAENGIPNCSSSKQQGPVVTGSNDKDKAEFTTRACGYERFFNSCGSMMLICLFSPGVEQSANH